MRVNDIAQTQVVTTFPGESLADAARRLLEFGIGSLVVMDGEAMVGMLTEHDFVAASAEGADAEATPVSRYMSADPVFATPGIDLAEAAAMMARQGIRHLPVVQDGVPVAKLATRDLLVVQGGDAASGAPYPKD